MELNTLFREWLLKRRITDSVINDFGLHGENEIIIPVTDVAGSFIFNKYRRNPLKDSGPKYWYDKGGEIMLYGAMMAKDQPSVLWAEGELDALTAWSLNIPAVSSTGGAKSIRQEWAQFFADKDVTICFDNDEAGGAGMVKALALVPNAKILFLPDRPGIKDISDYVMGGGDLVGLLKTAQRFESIEDVLDDKAERDALWKSTFFHDAYIESVRPKIEKRDRGMSSATSDISRAKEYPISELIKFSAGKAKCIWHNEKTASMTYYPTTNSTYCFGCGKSGDAIDVYKMLNDCGFSEAVKALNK